MINTKNNIASLIYKADMQVRDDLINGKIADEREYMSRLITLIQYPHGIRKNDLGYNSYYLSRTLNPRHERRFGCDIFFSFRYRNVVKLLCIESKNLQFRGNDDWDNFDNTSFMSRFTRQIKKQISLQKQGILVYEMFLNDQFKYFSMPGYDKNGSSLVKHSIANNYCIKNIDINPRKWFWEDIDQIVRIESTLGISNLKTVILNILDCKIGNKLGLNTNIGEDIFSFTIDDEEFQLPIPNLKDIRANEPISEKIIRQANDFMERFGISNLAFFQDAETDDSLPFFES